MGSREKLICKDFPSNVSNKKKKDQKTTTERKSYCQLKLSKLSWGWFRKAHRINKSNFDRVTINSQLYFSIYRNITKVLFKNVISLFIFVPCVDLALDTCKFLLFVVIFLSLSAHFFSTLCLTVKSKRKACRVCMSIFAEYKAMRP